MRDVVSVEVRNHGPSVPEWDALLSKHVGKVPPELRNQEITKCVPTTAAPSLPGGSAKTRPLVIPTGIS